MTPVPPRGLGSGLGDRVGKGGCCVPGPGQGGLGLLRTPSTCRNLWLLAMGAQGVFESPRNGWDFFFYF